MMSLIGRAACGVCSCADQWWVVRRTTQRGVALAVCRAYAVVGVLCTGGSGVTSVERVRALCVGVLGVEFGSAIRAECVKRREHITATGGVIGRDVGTQEWCWRTSP